MENPIQILTAGNISDYIELKHPHHPKDPAFIILKKGRIVYSENVDTVELTANHIAIIDSRKVYELQAISDGLEVLLLVFPKAYIEKLPLRINRLKAFVYIRNEPVQHLKLEEHAFDRIWQNTSLLNAVLQNPEPSEHRDEIIRHLFSAAVCQFADTITKAGKFTTDRISSKQKITLRFLKNVGEFYLEERDVAFYAEKQHITSRHLTAVLKEITGSTARQIIAAFLLKEAKAQLCSTDLSLYEIALNLKFSDQYSFGHFFKKNSGESPDAYRRQFKS